MSLSLISTPSKPPYVKKSKESLSLKIIDGKYKFADSYKQQFLVYTQSKDPYGNKVIRTKIKDRSIHYVAKIQN